MSGRRSLDEKMSMGLVVAGLVHVPCVEGSADGQDRHYAACMYTAFLRHGEPRPVVSHEFVESAVTCLRCAMRDFIWLEPVELELLRSSRRILCAQTMHARGIALHEAKTAMANWEAEEYVEYADVD